MRQFTNTTLRPAQILLLKAALFPPHEALPYWEQWRGLQQFAELPATTENLLPALFDPLDVDSQRLMPLVYRNLEHTGDPLVAYLRGIYRYTWLNNQRFRLGMQTVLAELNRAGIDAMLLKGLPLSLRYYGDLGVRMMSDLDVMVPTNRADEALRLVQQPPLSLNVTPFEYKFRHLLHAAHCWTADGVDIDLHWNLLYQHAYADADGPFWAERQPIRLPNGQQAYTLSPTHQLFHNLVHGFAWGLATPIRWVADSYVIYQQPDVIINWHDLLDLASRYGMTYPLRHGLRLLQAEFRLVLPPDVADRLETMPLPPAERNYYTLLAKKSPDVLRKTVRYLQKQRLAHRIFRQGKPGMSAATFVLEQLRFRLAYAAQ